MVHVQGRPCLPFFGTTRFFLPISGGRAFTWVQSVGMSVTSTGLGTEQPSPASTAPVVAVLLHLAVDPGVISFQAYPILNSFYHSFTIYDVSQPAKWIGLHKYRNLMENRYTRKALLYVVVSVPRG